MIKYLKEEVKMIKMFCFTVNGQEPRFDKGTRLLLKVFEQSFGPTFWDHMCVVYTRWGHDQARVIERKRSKLTEESRTNEVVAMLNEECPASKGKHIGVFFTNSFEITEAKEDRTSEALREIWTFAATLEDFACSNAEAVKVADWEAQYETLYNKYLNLINRIPIDGIDGTYKYRYKRTFKYVSSMKHTIKKQLSQEQFDKINECL